MIVCDGEGLYVRNKIVIKGSVQGGNAVVMFVLKDETDDIVLGILRFMQVAVGLKNSKERVDVWLSS